MKFTKEKQEKLDNVLNNIIPKCSGKWLNMIYGNKLEIIDDFVYPDSVTKLRPGNGKRGLKMQGGPQYVVIHDTGMTATEHNAQGINKYIHEQANSKEGRVASWHFSIDEKDLYQHIPTDEIAWHAGDGSRPFGAKEFNESSNKYDIGGGNQNGIGIETCINPDNDYLLTLKRTAKLTAQLLSQYNLSLDRVKQHYDFSSKFCPNVIKSTTDLWDSFLKDVEIELQLLSLGQDISVKWNTSNPTIEKSGKVNLPIHDTKVNLKLKITIDDYQKEYSYETLVKGFRWEEKIKRTYYHLLINDIPKKITSDLILPKSNEVYNTEISWQSSHPEVLDNNGKYTKPNQRTDLVLTATIKYRDQAQDYNFDIELL